MRNKKIYIWHVSSRHFTANLPHSATGEHVDGRCKLCTWGSAVASFIQTQFLVLHFYFHSRHNCCILHNGTASCSAASPHAPFGYRHHTDTITEKSPKSWRSRVSLMSGRLSSDSRPGLLLSRLEFVCFVGPFGIEKSAATLSQIPVDLRCAGFSRNNVAIHPALSDLRLSPPWSWDRFLTFRDSVRGPSSRSRWPRLSPWTS